MDRYWKWVSLTLVFVLALVIGLPALRRAEAAQPHLQAGLEHLRAAKAELDRASEDKGGHRAAALRSVADAIKHVELGISFDRRR